jgi:hypothetical protein
LDGLKLNHIPRRLSEAADTLAKMASSRQPIPLGIFASDQYKPSVRYEEPEQSEGEPPALGSGADQPPTQRSWSLMRSQQWSPTIRPTGGSLTSITSSARCSLPTKQRLDGSRAVLSPLSLSTGSFTSEATPGYYSAAFRSSKATSS